MGKAMREVRERNKIKSKETLLPMITVQTKVLYTSHYSKEPGFYFVVTLVT